MRRIPCSFFVLILSFLLSACASNPLPKTLATEHAPRLGIIGFKITAPIKQLSSILETPPKGLSSEEETSLLNEDLRNIEAKASKFLVEYLKEEKKIEPILIPDGFSGTHRGEAPSISQIEQLKKEFEVDAILYGEIPWYGKTRLIYPIAGVTLDIAAESVIIGVVTRWNAPLIFGNIGLELVTSTPLWFGGAYLYGVAFRPVTVDISVLSAENGKVVWHNSVDRIMSTEILKSYPESERSKKDVQLEASLRKVLLSLAESLSK